jgi:hypothetical protein
LAFDAASEYRKTIARDLGGGLGETSPEVIVIAHCVSKFVGRMWEVVKTGNGSVTVSVARKKYRDTTWTQTEFATD